MGTDGPFASRRTGVATRRRALVAVPVVLALTLRAVPLPFSHLGIETQLAYMQNALVGLARGDWRPNALQHGSAFYDVLRAAVAGCYHVGRVAGWYRDPLDPLANYLREPLPFVVVGRVAVLAAAVTTVWLVAVVGVRLFGYTAGMLGGLTLAVCVIHVRESARVWPDVPAAAALFATSAAAVVATTRSGWGSLLIAAAGAGIALATKHATAPVVLVIGFVAVCGGARRSFRCRVGRLAAAAATTTTTYLALSPYVFLDPAALLAQLIVLRHAFLPGSLDALTLRQAIGPCLGWPLVACAAVGAADAVRRNLPVAVVLSLFPLGYACVLQQSSLMYARYLVLLAPFASLFAGNGMVVVARLAGARWRPWVLLGLSTSVLMPAGIESVAQMRVLTRQDTRQVAGAWLRTHVDDTTPLTLPDLLGHASPVLPITPALLQHAFPAYHAALRARGVATPPAFPQRQWIAFFGQDVPTWQPRGVVVTASYPRRVPGLTSTVAVEKLRAAGAIPVAVFAGVPATFPERAVVDPKDAEYVPLRGAAAVLRPGPTLTIWRVPAGATDSH